MNLLKIILFLPAILLYFFLSIIVLIIGIASEKYQLLKYVGYPFYWVMWVLGWLLKLIGVF